MCVCLKQVYRIWRKHITDAYAHRNESEFSCKICANNTRGYYVYRMNKLYVNICKWCTQCVCVHARDTEGYHLHTSLLARSLHLVFPFPVIHSEECSYRSSSPSSLLLLELPLNANAARQTECTQTSLYTRTRCTYPSHLRCYTTPTHCCGSIEGQSRCEYALTTRCIVCASGWCNHLNHKYGTIAVVMANATRREENAYTNGVRIRDMHHERIWQEPERYSESSVFSEYDLG